VEGTDQCRWASGAFGKGISCDGRFSRAVVYTWSRRGDRAYLGLLSVRRRARAGHGKNRVTAAGEDFRPAARRALHGPSRGHLRKELPPMGTGLRRDRDEPVAEGVQPNACHFTCMTKALWTRHFPAPECKFTSTR